MKIGKTNWMIIMLLLLLLGVCAESKDPQVKKSKPELSAGTENVVKIEGTTFTRDDMEFYALMQKTKNELNRATDAEGLQGQALSASDAYWDAQNKMFDNVNVKLQNLIEIHAMSLLAEEKNYFVPYEELGLKVTEYYEIIEDNAAIQEMIKQYGEENHDLNVEAYMRESMLRDRVAADIEKTVLDELPDVTEQEIRYEVNTRYDELSMDQISGLEMKIYIQ